MQKPVFKPFLILLLALLALYSCVLVPAYQIIASDLVLMDTLWFDAVDLLLQWAEIAGSGALFAFAVFGAVRGGRQELKRMLLILGGALLFKYVAAILAISIVYGTIDFTYNYGGYIAAFLIEAGLLGALLYFSCRLSEQHQAKNRATKNAAATLGIAAQQEPPLLPFTAFFERKNPLQRIVMLAMGVYTALRLATFIISDIAFSVAGVLFTAADIPVMLLYWLILILIPCFLTYLMICLLLRWAEKRAAPSNEA
jgi:hypothetical protein